MYWEGHYAPIVSLKRLFEDVIPGKGRFGELYTWLIKFQPYLKEISDANKPTDSSAKRRSNKRTQPLDIDTTLYRIAMSTTEFNNGKFISVLD
jgi:hypothetical protein